MRFVDSHAHMHEPEYRADLDDVLQRCRAAGMESCVTVGTDRTSSRSAVALAARHPDIFATLAVHPHDARDWSVDVAAEFRTLVRDPRVVAIGEIGLDFYRNLSPREDQFRAFREQLELADEVGLPVVVHSRDAGEETAAILEEWSGLSHRSQPVGVIHCFSGDLPLAMRYIDAGFLISIAGPVTYPRTEALQETARVIPLETMTVETDAPFLSPQGRRGKRNEPWFVLETIETIATLRGERAEVIAAATADNAIRLFRLAEQAGVR